MSPITKFLEINNLKQIDLIHYLGISKAYMSQIVNGSSKLSSKQLTKLISNENGWDTTPLTEFCEDSRKSLVNVATNSHDIHQVTADDKLIAVIQEQQTQLGRLITVIENLTSNAK